MRPITVLKPLSSGVKWEQIHTKTFIESDNATWITICEKCFSGIQATVAAYVSPAMELEPNRALLTQSLQTMVFIDTWKLDISKEYFESYQQTHLSHYQWVECLCRALEFTNSLILNLETTNWLRALWNMSEETSVLIFPSLIV